MAEPNDPKVQELLNKLRRGPAEPATAPPSSTSAPSGASPSDEARRKESLRKALERVKPTPGLAAPDLRDYEGPRASRLGIKLKPEIAEALGDADPVLPTTTVTKAQTGVAGIGEGPTGVYMGQTGIDVSGLRTKIAKAFLNRRTKEYEQTYGAPPTPEQVSEWYNEETSRAHQEISDWIKQDTGKAPSLIDVPWVDTDPAGAQQSLSDWAQQGTGRQMIAPFLASTMGSALTVNDKGLDGPESASYNEGDFWGGLDWVSRFSVGTYLATAAAASGVDSAWDFANPTTWKAMYDAWGTPEHLKLISRGEDAISLSRELGLGDLNLAVHTIGGALQAAGLIEESTRQSAADYTAGFMVSLLDPDLFSVATLGAGKISKFSKLSELPAAIGLGAKAKMLTRSKLTEDVATMALEAAYKAEKGLDPAESQKAADEIFAALRGNAKGLEVATARYAAAVIGKSKPVTKQAFNMVRWAAQARKSYIDKFGDLEAATVQAGAAAQEAGSVLSAATPVQKSAAQAEYAFKVLQLDHMARESVLSSLVAHRKAITRLGQHMGDKAAGADAAALDAALVTSIKDLQAAQEALVNAPDAAVAQKAFETASANYSKAAFEASSKIPERAAQSIDALIAQASTAAKLAKDALDKQSTAAHKLGIPDVPKTMKAHTRAVSSVQKSSARAWSDRSYFTAIAKASRDMSRGYKMALKAIDDTGPELALALQTEAAVAGMKHVDVGAVRRSVIKMRDSLDEIYDPAKYALGSTDEQVQLVSTAATGQLGLHQHEVIQLTQGLNRQAQAGVLRQYISTQAPMGANTFLNTLGDAPMWDRARPVLRAMMQSDELANKAVDSLVAMWFPTGRRAPELTESVRGALRRVTKNLLETGALNKKTGSAQAAANLTWKEFEESLLQATHRETGISVEQLKEGEATAMGIAVQAVAAAAITADSSEALLRMTGPVPFRVIKAAEAISLGNSYKAGANYLDAMELFETLKMPSHVRKLQRDTMADLEMGVRALSEDVEGFRGLIPAQFIAQMNTRLERLVKSTEAVTLRSGTPSVTYAKQAAWTLNRLYQTSLITGLVFPKPAYYTAMAVGNFGQVWQKAGLIEAIKNSTQLATFAGSEMATHIPWFGKYLDKARTDMAKRLAQPVDRVLPSLTSAMFNPHLALVYDPGAVPNSFEIGGRLAKMKMGEMRKHLVDQGIFTSFASSSGLQDVLSRSAHVSAAITYWEKFKGAINKPREAFADMANALETRQRVGLFTDLVLNKGYSPEQAGRIARGAFYDWNSPLSSLETQFITKLFMFWGFMRRALAQGAQALLAPFSREAINDSAFESMLKSSSVLSKLSGRQAYESTHLRDMVRAQHALKEFSRDDPTIQDEELRRVYPWWAAHSDNKTWLTNVPLSPQDQEWNKRYARDGTMTAYTMPSMTPVEMAGFWASQTQLLGAYAASGFTEPEHLKGALDESAKQFGGRLTGPALEAAIGAMFGEEKQGFHSDSAKAGKFTERMVLQTIGGDAFIWHDKKKNQMRTHRGVHAAYQTFTPISYELSNWLEPMLEDPIERRGMVEGVGYMMRQWSAVGREYEHNPKVMLGYDKKDLSRKAASLSKQERYKARDDVDFWGAPIEDDAEEAGETTPGHVPATDDAKVRELLERLRR